ncbi:4-coumarate--CoA ligase-like 10 [Apostasia shenzhenica]|uniref:4-coumarate--CoA ligase n=1 Tax=Apostasia shenzhenica TaxID=1088818 RepID=A0A2I0AR53_9ASPA|nr:4-coumarate--CoA ligase-like 10 [Apostasia shenzhenica]
MIDSEKFVIVFLAVIRVRATAAPLNPIFTQEEFEFYLFDSESKLLLTNKKGNDAAEAAAGKLGILRATVDFSDPSFDVFIDLLSASGCCGKASVDRVFNDASDVALFLHTSGTTSRPKGVPLTQHNLAASVRNIRMAYRLNETDSTLVVLPLFHVHGLIAGLLSSFSAGAAVALPASSRFSASNFWAEMRAAGATWYTAVPTIHQILLDRHAAAPEQDYPKLRFIRSCSAWLPPAVLAGLEAVFGAPVLESYAMTEAAHLIASNPLPEDGLRKPGSVGMPVGQHMAILDEDGAVQPPGTAGEVCIRGPNVVKGYKNNPEANVAAFLFGWFHTGDVGCMDDDGYIHLVGRIKELINRGGEKISPIEVDAVLLSHPAVAQAVAFGVPDKKYGEEINCAIILRKGAVIDVEEVARHCRKNLAPFKVPKRIFVAESLPKTATGKIKRQMVAELFVLPAEESKAAA